MLGRGRHSRSDPDRIDQGLDRAPPGLCRRDALAREIQDFVEVQLAAHEYPRFVQFAETLPMTATGKVLRGSCGRWGKLALHQRPKCRLSYLRSQEP